jgi:DNA-binding CsgD family transcriptional regulator/tetratricopeptide (TPR) repeat protein
MSHPEITTCEFPRSLTLLERDEPLAALKQALELTRHHGSLVAISGEAGIGKSSLLEAFARNERECAEFLWGTCDALKTPSPLGPLMDIAAALGSNTAQHLRASVPRHELFATVVDDLARRTHPVVVIFEDVHWADEATLDLLQYVGRRIDRTAAVLVVTWRDDQVDLDHAIHRVLGSWRQDNTLRIQLEPFSIDAVRQLAGCSRDALALYNVTGGNPFFVTEALSARNETVPLTVREAMLARRAGLDADARAVLDFVSIVPSRTEYTLLETALKPSRGAVERCIAAGLLKSESHTVAFRHELARMAVAHTLPPLRTHQYHRLVLKALLERFDRSDVLARIVHHAEASGATEMILDYAPAAARQAAIMGAHRQAVEHYRLALAHSDQLSEHAKANLLENFAYENYVTGDIESARKARRTALVLWKRLDVPQAIGRNIRWLSRLAWFAGDRAEAETHANDAIDLLSRLDETAELAMAYSNRSQLDMKVGNLTGSIHWGNQSIELARRLRSVDVLSHALNNVGSARANAGDPAGILQLEESLDLALSNDLHEHAARAFTNLASYEVTRRNYADARQWLQRGIAYTAERDLDTWSLYMQALRARLCAETGTWSDACEDAEAVLAAPRATTVSRIAALSALGRVHVRRGDADALAILDEALILARPIREPQRLIPILTARAELAWMTGRPEEISTCIGEALEALPVDNPPVDCEVLTYWQWRAGAKESGEANGNGPHALLMKGDWRAAAAYWLSKGCRYEYAEALMEGDLAATKGALEVFQALGAAPAMEWARQRLRRLGGHRLPRGRRPTTRSHPAGLTKREGEILLMLARGLPNRQIAARLFVSRKTIEHHVSAILGKLEVPSREAAVSRAREEGWLMPYFA